MTDSLPQVFLGPELRTAEAFFGEDHGGARRRSGRLPRRFYCPTVAVSATPVRWLMTLPGPGDHGPLTLLEYLRLALLVHGGFTGLDAANPNFDPLRRALIADLEPF